MTALLSFLCECEKAKFGIHWVFFFVCLFLMSTRQGLVFIIEKSGRKNVNYDHVSVLWGFFNAGGSLAL